MRLVSVCISAADPAKKTKQACVLNVLYLKCPLRSVYGLYSSFKKSKVLHLE